MQNAGSAAKHSGVSNSPDTAKQTEEVLMSISTLLHVLNHSKTKKSHRLVLIEIANHVNDESGLAWPSQNTIARRTGLSRRWVNEIIGELAATGELKIIPEGGPDGEQAYSIQGCELTSHPPPQRV